MKPVATFVNARYTGRPESAPVRWHGRVADMDGRTEGGAYQTIAVCPHLHRTITAASRCAHRLAWRLGYGDVPHA